uniref:Uncharacterized protein n=1 Tax=Glossina palpalis gambiensis TaxID=67801 RepID=A0A1B0BGX4_9MUSC
ILFARKRARIFERNVLLYILVEFKIFSLQNFYLKEVLNLYNNRLASSPKTTTMVTKKYHIIVLFDERFYICRVVLLNCQRRS